MIEKEVLRELLDHKKIDVLKFLYFAKEEVYLRELASKSGVAVSSVHRIVQELMRLGLVRMKEVGTMKFYSLVRNERSQFLENWFKEENYLEVFIEVVRQMAGVKKVLLQGKVEDKGANVILIGEGVDESKIDQVCDKIKEKGFDLSCVVFNAKQFEKLDKMGVYAGEKKVLL